MTTRTLIRLLIILALFAGAAYYVNQKPASRVQVGGIVAGDKALPSLDINAVDSIQLSSISATVSLRRAESGWTVDSLHGYPAQFSSIAQFLRKLPDITYAQVLREGEASLAELSLDESVVAPDLLAVTLGQTGQLPVRIVLGAMKRGRDQGGMGFGGMPQGRFVRVGDGPVAAVDEAFVDLGSRSEDWIDREFVAINGADVKRVKIITSEGTLDIARGEGEDFTLEGLSGDETLDASAVTRVFQGLQWSRIDSVIDPALSDDEAGLGEVDTVVFHTTNDIAYELVISRTDAEGGKSVRLKISDLSEGGANADEVKAIDDRHAAWRYKLASGTLSQVLPSRESLLAAPVAGEVVE